MLYGPNRRMHLVYAAVPVSAGESILFPATTQDITITPEGRNVKLLETYV